MTRIPVTTACLALVLATAACEAPRRYHEHDRTAYEERHGDRVDINSASERELARLPGVDRDDAERIIANRPYESTDSLVDRGIIGARKYDRIESYVYAGRTRHESRDDRWDDRDRQRWYDDR